MCPPSAKGGIGKRVQKEASTSGIGRISSRQPPLSRQPLFETSGLSLWGKKKTDKSMMDGGSLINPFAGEMWIGSFSWDDEVATVELGGHEQEHTLPHNSCVFSAFSAWQEPCSCPNLRTQLPLPFIQPSKDNKEIATLHALYNAIRHYFALFCLRICECLWPPKLS